MLSELKQLSEIRNVRFYILQLTGICIQDGLTFQLLHHTFLDFHVVVFRSSPQKICLLVSYLVSD